MNVYGIYHPNQCLCILVTIEERAKEISTVIRNNYGRYKAAFIGGKRAYCEMYDDYMSVVNTTDKKLSENQDHDYYNSEKRWNKNR